MIDMTSRTGSIAIWPSCIMFGVSFPAPKGRFVSALAVFVFTHSSRTRLLLDAAPNRGVERKKKIGPQFGPDVGRPTSVWDHPG